MRGEFLERFFLSDVSSGVSNFSSFEHFSAFEHCSSDILSEAFVKNTIIRISQAMLSFFGDTC